MSDSEDEGTKTTLCDRDRVDNVWLQGADENGEGGVCLLDTMNEAQVIYSLQRDDRARADLLRVTSNERLRELANTVPRLSEDNAGDRLQREINRPDKTIPFYSQFRGKIPWQG